MLLVNSRSISAAENFALAMRSAPHAVVMGETTAGVMADAGTQPLPNGWQVTVPVNQFRDANGVSWEGVGVTPDLWVKNDRADVEAGTDRALETAPRLPPGRRRPAPGPLGPGARRAAGPGLSVPTPSRAVARSIGRGGAQTRPAVGRSRGRGGRGVRVHHPAPP